MEQYDSENVYDHLMPLGKISLITVAEDQLFIIDSASIIHQIPVQSPQIRFYFLASGGQPKSALQV